MPDDTPSAPAKSGAAPARPKKAPAVRRAPAPAAPRPAPRTPAPANAAPRAAPAPRRTPPPSSPPPATPSGTVVDATGLVLGRAASRIAKRLLEGESIIVVNAEKSVVTGSRTAVLEIYRANRARGSKRSGPHFPRYPDRIFRRTVRGMLPHLKTRGREALDRLEVHIGVPPEYSGAPRQSVDGALATPALRAPMTLQEITRLLGARV